MKTKAGMPMVLGHEGAGIVEEVGPGVTRVAAGDHVVCSFIPNCGTCRYCATGRQSICDWGATILEGYLPGPRFPLTGLRGQYGAMCMLGTFSQYGVIHQNSAVKVDDDMPLDKAVLVGCGVPTGWGSAVNTANVAPGDTVAVYGIGGIGINAVQGARYAGAKNVVVVTGLNKLLEPTIQLPGTILTLFRKTVKGSLFGDCNPTTDIPKILGLYQAGDLKLDEIITRTYTLDEVGEGYDDLLAGKNVRGVVILEH
jgi:alcohol dehydrogenase (nicotinoprotein)